MHPKASDTASLSYLTAYDSCGADSSTSGNTSDDDSPTHVAQNASCTEGSILHANKFVHDRDTTSDDERTKSEIPRLESSKNTSYSDRQVYGSDEHCSFSLPYGYSVPRRDQSASISSVSSEGSLPSVNGGLQGARTSALRCTWLAADKSPLDAERILYAERRQDAKFQHDSTLSKAWKYLQRQSVTAPVHSETGTSGIHIRGTDSDPRSCESSGMSREHSTVTPISESTPKVDRVHSRVSLSPSSSDSVPLAQVFLSAARVDSHAIPHARTRNVRTPNPNARVGALASRKRSAASLTQDTRPLKRARRTGSDNEYVDGTSSNEDNDEEQSSSTQGNENAWSRSRITRLQTARGSWQTASYRGDRPRRSNVQYDR